MNKTITTEKVLLETYLNNILPCGSVLFKDSELWIYYKSDTDFQNGNESFRQRCNETMHAFIERIVKGLMHIEETNKDPEPLVTIDYAIFSKPKYNTDANT